MYWLSLLTTKGGLCADTILENEEEFAPFCEFTEDVTSFEQYASRVRNSADWGGHLGKHILPKFQICSPFLKVTNALIRPIELRALSRALKRPIHVYSVQSGGKPLEIHDDSTSEKNPIRLSYHLHYYALGEHYNQVVER